LKLTRKAPSRGLLVVAFFTLFIGFLNLSRSTQIVYFNSSIYDLSSTALQSIDSQLPKTLWLTNRLRTHTLLTRDNFPGDFMRHFWVKMSMNLLMSISIVIFYLIGVYFHKNEPKNAKFFANSGIVVSLIMIFYSIFYPMIFDRFIYSEILSKFSKFPLDPEIDTFGYVLFGVFATFVFYKYRQALPEHSSLEHQPLS
jgi:hypothetical protein